MSRHSASADNSDDQARRNSQADMPTQQFSRYDDDTPPPVWRPKRKVTVPPVVQPQTRRVAPEPPPQQYIPPEQPVAVADPPRRRKAKKRKQPKISASLVLGELMLTVGVVVLLFAFYESYWTNIESAKIQHQVSNDLDEKWKKWVNPRQKIQPELGAAFARMYIPAFGSDFNFAIVHGTSDTDLAAGPGHYVDSQLPGEKGNFAVAGHRVGKGAPFNDLDKLQACDAIVVETQSAWLTYRVLPFDVSGEQRLAEAQKCLSPEQAARVAAGDYASVQGRYITTPSDVGTIGARPGNPDQTPAEDMEPIMTLTTCHPQFSNAERMIVHAMLVEAHPKEENYRPPALEGA